MSNAAAHNKEPIGLDLPDTAPQVRITAGFGSPTQKTWNLRRPVTLIGSCRPASIVLHDKDVSKAHCVIVNTGTDVLLKDLHTAGGTLCNNNAVDLAVLADGDVVTIGGMKLQLAIQQVRNPGADDSGCGMEFVEPGKLPTPALLRLEHTEHVWKINDAVVLIGRHEQAAIRLDRPEVSARHAVLFRFQQGPAIFDLGNGNGVSLNGRKTAIAVLARGDRAGIGPFTLTVDEGAPTSEEVRGNLPSQTSPPDPAEPAKPASHDEELSAETIRALNQIQADLSTLEKSISQTWNNLNTDEKPPRLEPAGMTVQTVNLEERARALDARDAMLRGQMHDLTRYHEQLAAKERDLAAQIARIQTRRDELTSLEHTFKERDADMHRRGEELKRREHVLAQRWTRLLSSSCPHCNRPLNLNQPGPADAMP